MKDDRMPPEEWQDTTIAQLLHHLQEMRQAVPVNYRLKAELKAKLLERLQEMEQQRSGQTIAVKVKRRKVWWLYGGVLALTLTALLTIWTGDGLAVRVEQMELGTEEITAEGVSIAPDGKRIGIITPAGTLVTKEIQGEGTPKTVRAPESDSKYRGIAWSSDGRMLAMTEQQQDVARLWIADVRTTEPTPISRRLVKEEAGVQYTHPAWSPDNRRIAFTRSQHGRDEVWVTSTVSLQEEKLTDGSMPVWSPDGEKVAFTRDNQVMIYHLSKGDITIAGKGQWPSWSGADRVSFTHEDGRLVEAYLDRPQTELYAISLPGHIQTGLIRAEWSLNGKDALILYQEKDDTSIAVARRR